MVHDKKYYEKKNHALIAVKKKALPIALGCATLLLNSACITNPVLTHDNAGNIRIYGKTSVKNGRVYIFSDKNCTKSKGVAQATGKTFKFFTSSSSTLSFYGKDDDPDPTTNKCTRLGTYHAPPRANPLSSKTDFFNFGYRNNWILPPGISPDGNTLTMVPILQTKDTRGEIYSGGAHKLNLPGRAYRYLSADFKISSESFNDFDHASIFPAYKNSTPFERLGIAIYKERACIEWVDRNGILTFLLYKKTECFPLAIPLASERTYTLRSLIRDEGANLDIFVSVEGIDNNTYGGYAAKIPKESWYSNTDDSNFGVFFGIMYQYNSYATEYQNIQSYNY